MLINVSADKFSRPNPGYTLMLEMFSRLCHSSADVADVASDRIAD